MKLPNPIVYFLRLEPLYFIVNLLCFWLKLKREKIFIKKKTRQIYRKIGIYVSIVFNNQMCLNR